MISKHALDSARTIVNFQLNYFAFEFFHSHKSAYTTVEALPIKRRKLYRSKNRKQLKFPLRLLRWTFNWHDCYQRLLLHHTIACWYVKGNVCWLINIDAWGSSSVIVSGVNFSDFTRSWADENWFFCYLEMEKFPSPVDTNVFSRKRWGKSLRKSFLWAEVLCWSVGRDRPIKKGFYNKLNQLSFPPNAVDGTEGNGKLSPIASDCRQLLIRL